MTPNAPTQPELIDTYQLRLWIHNQLVYDQVHSVRNWQMRHFYVEKIARAFCHVQDLIGKKIYLPSENGSDEPSNPAFLSFVHAELNTEWLTVLLSANHTKQKGDLVHVLVFLQQSEHRIGDIDRRSLGQWGEWREMLSARIICKPEEAVNFGAQLSEEIKQVEQARDSLGIPEYDDPSQYEW